MENLGKRTFESVLKAETLEMAIRGLSEHVLANLLEYAESAPGWAAHIIYGVAAIEAARRFKLDNLQPNFP
jgi:hypothetical protein